VRLEIADLPVVWASLQRAHEVSWHHGGDTSAHASKERLSMVGVAVGYEPWASGPAVRRVMQDIRPEIALRRALHAQGFRCRVAATLDLLQDGA